MPKPSSSQITKRREAAAILRQLGFAGKQANDTAALTFLALLDLAPDQDWEAASAPLRGITPIIQFVAKSYRVRYAPNTRETIRDDAVKFFTEAGLLLRNPDDPHRPTNSGKTVYQIEPTALALIRSFGSASWTKNLEQYRRELASIRDEIVRARHSTRVKVTLTDGTQIGLSAGGQNPLIKALVETFGPIFAPGATVAYIGDTETKFKYLDTAYLAKLGIHLGAAAKMPDVIIHDTKRNWLLLVEAVTSAGPVDGKRRMELKQLFRNATAGLVFVTAFETRKAMQSFLGQISWESEVWIIEDPEHMLHFNGGRFLGPYPDAMPQGS